MSRRISLDSGTANEFIELNPSGPFAMGSIVEEIAALVNSGVPEKYLTRELPRHYVTLDLFCLSRDVVTVGDYAEFVMATGYRTTSEQQGEGSLWNGSRWISLPGVTWRHALNVPVRDAHRDAPVVRLFYEDAKAFCDWSTSHLPEELSQNGYAVRLPTEAEWEYAASIRETDPLYESFIDRLRELPVVSELPEDSVGLRGMCGVVWQWCEDFYWNDFYQRSPMHNPVGRPEAEFHSLRGGNIYFPARGRRTTYRSCPSGNYSSYGFRLCLGNPAPWKLSEIEEALQFAKK